MSILGTALTIAGDDEFLRARHRNDALAAARAAVGDLTVAMRNGEALTPADVWQGLAVDLFGGVPVLVIQDGQKMTPPVLAAVTDWCTSNPGDALLIVEVVTGGNSKAPKDTVAALKKAGAKIVEAPAPKGADRRKFADTELRRAGLAADPDAARVLVDYEPDLRGIAIRVQQLAADLDTGTDTGRAGRLRVSADHVAQVASSTGAASGFAVADALVTRDPRALADALRTATETGTAAPLIVSACLGALRDIMAVQSGKTGKMPPWKAQKAQRNARRWTGPALARAIEEIGGAHPALGYSGRRDSDVAAALLRAITS